MTGRRCAARSRAQGTGGQVPGEEPQPHDRQPGGGPDNRRVLAVPRFLGA